MKNNMFMISIMLKKSSSIIYKLGIMKKGGPIH